MQMKSRMMNSHNKVTEIDFFKKPFKNEILKNIKLTSEAQRSQIDLKIFTVAAEVKASAHTCLKQVHQFISLSAHLQCK